MCVCGWGGGGCCESTHPLKYTGKQREEEAGWCAHSPALRHVPRETRRASRFPVREVRTLDRHHPEDRPDQTLSRADGILLPERGGPKTPNLKEKASRASERREQKGS